MKINKLVEEVHENAVNHGWWEGEKNFGELIVLCHSELSEVIEEARNGRATNETYYTLDAQGMAKPEGVPSELADVVIRIMDICGNYGIDLEAIIKEKHEYNKKRPYKHGKKF